MDFFIDTEFAGNRLLQVAIVDEEDRVVFHSLVRPESLKFDAQWRITSKIHGITPKDVRGAPSLSMVRRRVLELCVGQRVIGYGVGADVRHFPLLKQYAFTVCAMKAYKDWSEKPQGIKLSAALEECGIDWSFGRAHGALADARATRALWLWMRDRRSQKALSQFDRLPDGGAEKNAPVQHLDPADQARLMAERFAPQARSRQKSVHAVDPRYPNKGTPWALADSQWVQQSWLQGLSVVEMAQRLGRTPAAIVARAVRLGLAEDPDVVRSIDAARHAIMDLSEGPSSMAA